MTVVELKKALHEKIEDLTDPDYLDMLNTMLSYKDKVFEISKEHLEGIRQGEEDIKNGYIYSMEDFEKKYAHYLKQ